MKKYTVTGMSCAACSSRVEKAVSGVDKVESCSVNLLTNQMIVEGDAHDADIIKAVEKAGYGIKETTSEKKEQEDIFNDNETPLLKKRLLSSVIFLVLLMYVSMGHVMWGWSLPAFLDGNYIAIAVLQMLFAICVIVINNKFFKNGFRGIIKGNPNMDSLVALGSSASFLYSTYVLFLMTNDATKINMAATGHYMHDLYFEASAMILAFITVGKMLEARSKGKTTNALKSLMKLSPKKAILLKDGKEIEIDAKDINKGDIFIVKPGNVIPADAVVKEGNCAVDESALTGESMPVDKGVGDRVCAATINKSGFIKCEATKVGEDTLLSQIINMVIDAQATKAPIAKVADKVSGKFVPAIIIIAAITTIIWLAFGYSLGFSIARGVSVLVISCPCALGLATPVSIMVANGVGARNGILFKTAASLEEAGRIKIVALDKTGTITVGEPEVTDVITIDTENEKSLLEVAYSLESKSEHPLAKAVMKFAKSKGCTLKENKDFEVFPGNGIKAIIDGREYKGGNLEFIENNSLVPTKLLEQVQKLSEEGKTPMLFADDEKVLGVIAVADKIKEDSKKAITELKKMGISVVMITGDNINTAKAVAKKVGIDEIVAGVLPQGKNDAIKKQKKKGKVAMVGDGINDAPALACSDVSIAIGNGTDVAIDAADIVLMKNSLQDVVKAIGLSRKTLKNIYENLFWTFIYNIIAVPLAAGVLIHSFGIKMNPMIAAAAMSLSSFSVVTNALRLNFIKFSNKKKGSKQMEITLNIEGMMCGHCEKRVKDILEETKGVISADVSHEKAMAKVKLAEDVDIDILKNKITDEGYKVL